MFTNNEQMLCNQSAKQKSNITNIKYCSWDDFANDKKEQELYKENALFIAEMYKKYA